MTEPLLHYLQSQSIPVIYDYYFTLYNGDGKVDTSKGISAAAKTQLRTFHANLLKKQNLERDEVLRLAEKLDLATGHQLKAILHHLILFHCHQHCAIKSSMDSLAKLSLYVSEEEYTKALLTHLTKQILLNPMLFDCLTKPAQVMENVAKVNSLIATGIETVIIQLLPLSELFSVEYLVNSGTPSDDLRTDIEQLQLQLESYKTQVDELEAQIAARPIPEPFHAKENYPPPPTFTSIHMAEASERKKVSSPSPKPPESPVPVEPEKKHTVPEKVETEETESEQPVVDLGAEFPPSPTPATTDNMVKEAVSIPLPMDPDF